MGEFDPVSWDTIEAVSGPPVAAVIEYVERLQTAVSDEKPSVAIKTIYDTWKGELGDDRTVPDQGAAFVIAYSLERTGVITLGDRVDDLAFHSLTARRPSSEHLHELFWERKLPMWLIAVQVGVHWSIIQLWLYEDGIPLMERNITAELMEQIRRYREPDTNDFCTE